MWFLEISVNRKNRNFLLKLFSEFYNNLFSRQKKQLLKFNERLENSKSLLGETYELENQFLKQQLESEIARQKETNEKVIKLQEQLEKYRAASESPTIGNTGEFISEEVSMLRYFILIR